MALDVEEGPVFAEGVVPDLWVHLKPFTAVFHCPLEVGVEAQLYVEIA